MIINKHSQLALRMDSNACLDRFERLVNAIVTNQIRKKGYAYETAIYPDGTKRDEPIDISAYRNIYEFLTPDVPGKIFLIRDSAIKESRKIDLNNAFSGKIFSKVPKGIYTYLLGPNSMFKFSISDTKLMGYYYADLNSLLISVMFDTTSTDNGDIVGNKKIHSAFSEMLKLLVFIELGELEIEIVEPGNSSKKDTKELNESGNTVYVVDSSWNTMIVRLEGFGVKGHYRLQACGEGMRDRKLIWINHFEKHGYIRRPKARILHNSIS